MSAIRGGQYTGTEALTVYTDRELQNATGATPTLVQDNSVVAGYTDISINFYPGEKDLINGQGDQWYDCSIWVPAVYTMAQMYQFLKYVTRYTSVDQFYQLNADDGQEYRSAAETAGGGATAQGPYTDVKVAPFGTLAGTTFFGARGIWVNGGTTADFVLLDSDGVSQSPPNYQKVTVTHDNLVGVQIFVAEITSAGGTIIKDQYAVDASTASTLTVDPAIDSNKTPENGKFRIGDLQYVYTSFSGTVFSGITPEPSAPVDSSVYVPFLDVLADTNPEISANVIYGGDVDVRTVVRKYGFKPYTADTTFGSTGLSFSPILTTDPQAT
jgi:hypothetical protein